MTSSLWYGIAFATGLAVGGIAAASFTHAMTRDKWFAQGHGTGRLSGQAEVMAKMCAALPHNSGAPAEAAYVLDVKASRLSITAGDGGALRLYCQDPPPGQ
ncbi:hypothetical protein [uncultured Hoeflea sp.]|uniref:hypothetical protein n=1 Tax=uncultured Hoeflea sp. TaxID=538666 RepID=UPI0026333674|nr:hypothetical protein [uncultured Hoeflea sp.]